MDPSKFAPRVDNTKCEKTGERSTAYSLWHRTLGSEYWIEDVDYVEYRKGRGIVAFIGVTNKVNDENHLINSKKYIWKRTELEREILKQLSEKMRVPSFFVIHTTDLSVFHVHRIGEDLNKYVRMTQEEYATFIKTL